MSSLFLCGSLGRWLLLGWGRGGVCVRVCEWVQLSAVTRGGGGRRSQLYSAFPLLSGPVIGQLKLGEMLTAELQFSESSPILRCLTERRRGKSHHQPAPRSHFNPMPITERKRSGVPEEQS